MNKCKDCKHWDEDGNATGLRACFKTCDERLERTRRAVGCVHENPIYTGPDFGCVHWEAKR